MSDSIIHFLLGALAIIFIRVLSVGNTHSSDADVAVVPSPIAPLQATMYLEQKNLKSQFHFTHYANASTTKRQNSLILNDKSECEFENLYTIDLLRCYNYLCRNNINRSPNVKYAVGKNNIIRQ